MSLRYNWNIIGHETPLRLLEQDLSGNNLAHAYLFDGTDGIGKFSVAKTLAHILQCPNNYCRDCAVCTEIDKGYHSDTIELADNGTHIKIEEVRGILARLHMSRQNARKILLIQNIERMTPESANAMLKNLEEPPEGVIFLLTTSRIKEVLSTIVSRVRVLHFYRLPESKVTELVQHFYPLVDGDQLETVGSYALGKPGKALDFMSDPGLLESYRAMYHDANTFVQKPDVAAQFSYITELVKTSKDEEDNTLVKDFLDILSAVLRKALIEDLDRGSPRTPELVRALKEAQRAHDLLKRNINKRLLLENLMLQL